MNLWLTLRRTCDARLTGAAGVYNGEYCDTEVFRAECPEGEVIIMERARYGRLKIGRCVEIDLGHIGCFSDVLPLTDRRCSGKRVCEIRIPDAEFESTRPCLKELKTYLEASYQCVAGMSSPRALFITIDLLLDVWSTLSNI